MADNRTLHTCTETFLNLSCSSTFCYNHFKIADRLFSSIGQDSLDALFWTAAEPKERRSIIRLFLHLGLAFIYICILLY